MENKTIYENYYKKNNKKLWDKFEPVILINNRKLKIIIENKFKFNTETTRGVVFKFS